MQIYGCIKNDENNFDFYCNTNNKQTRKIEDFYTFSDKKIFIYIDGTISKISETILQSSQNFESIEKKIAYIYSTGFKLEGHICGSFNIFLYDYNSKNFKIIRDTRATRLIYYAKDKKSFIFSSEQSNLIKKIQNVTLNKDKLIEFLNWDYTSDDKTYFNEIHKVKPSHTLSYIDNNIIIEKYQLQNNLFAEPFNTNYKANFKKFFYQSVSVLANKDKKIGVMMSGGLDSSAIAIALKENYYENVHTYSANFSHVSDNKNLDEAVFQKNIADLTSYSHSYIEMEGKSPIIPIQKFTKEFCQPLCFPNIYIYKEIINKLNADGIEILLDGSDGDNTISHGFEALYTYFISLRFFKFIKEIFLYSKFKRASFLRLLYVFIKEALRKLFKMQITENKHSLLQNHIQIKKNPNNIISFFSSHERKLSIDLHFLANESRNQLFRFFGIENFSPFYEEELINFCINMPNEYKISNGYTRKILRNFLSDFLPKSHSNRDKSVLTPGAIKNFSVSDLKIIKTEYKNINKILLNVIDDQMLKNIFEKLDNSFEINEEELINLQIFVSANTFLNMYKF
jgi:asparagine synthase (glutamine-hydrolysing)